MLGPFGFIVFGFFGVSRGAVGLVFLWVCFGLVFVVGSWVLVWLCFGVSFCVLEWLLVSCFVAC